MRILSLLPLAALAFLPPPPSAAQSSDISALMGPGVSKALAEYRAARISDVRYELHLDVTGRDTATGTVTIHFTRRPLGPTTLPATALATDSATDTTDAGTGAGTDAGEVILDFRGHYVRNAVINGTPVAQLTYNGAHIHLPSNLLRDGENIATFEFGAPIAPSGASIIRFDDTSDQSTYLYTLLVPADANQLFPCFDQPDLKARVLLELTVPPTWTAVSNELLRDSVRANRGKTYRFAETEPISTYLIAFAAGPWSKITQTVQGQELNMYVRASRAHEAEADSLIAANARALFWLEDYFGIGHPFSKLDFVLAPAFPFGGMEHPGAIFYNEDRFIFREPPTQPQRIAREQTIYHEIAHLWFGDYVTMKWFDDLWLKEGFATYMAAKMQDAISPQYGAWKTFYLRNKPLAYAVDLTQGTNPVWQELSNLDQAKSNYGPIVYNKAPSILKQLEYLVGANAFRQGVHSFLSTHAYANATWQDLLAAIGGAANRSLDEWGSQYILRPGIPVVQQEIWIEGDTLAGITLHQFPAQPLSGPDAWPIRTEVMVGLQDAPPLRIPVEITGDSAQVPIPPATPAPTFVYANAGDYGYLSLTLDPGSAIWLMENIGSIDDPLLRAMAWGSLWDLVRNADLSPSEFLDIVQRTLPKEKDEQIVSAVLSRTVRAAGAYLSREQQAKLLPTLTSTLRDNAYDMSHSYGVRKASLDAMIALASDSASLHYLDSALDSTSLAGEPLRAPTRWAIVTKLVQQFTVDAQRRVNQEIARDTTSDGKRRAFIAGAAHPTEGTKRAYFTAYLNDSTLNEDWATASLTAFNSLNAQELTLPYLRQALDALPWVQKNRRIFFLGNWLEAFINGQTSAEALQTVYDFLQANPTLPEDLRKKVLQAVDELERTVTIRAQYASVIDS